MVIFQVNLGHPVPPSDPPPPPVLLLVKRVFYELEVLPATQPSVSKHWREHKALTITSSLTWSILHPPLNTWWKGHCSLYAASLARGRLHTKKNCSSHLTNQLTQVHLRMAVKLATYTHNSLLNIYFRQGGYVLWSSLFVCLYVCLCKNFQMDLHEIFGESWCNGPMNKWLHFGVSKSVSRHW